uniref:Amphiregulin n=1 Tax=Geotrypetes seraphini TaxID=260995 RepID=A0A6P8P4B9_GEOSA|nr:amphiregulin [Geotrypetes seraphini]
MDPILRHLLLFAVLASYQVVVGLEVNTTGHERNVSVSKEHSLNRTEVIVTDDYEESEEDLSQYEYTEDLIRVEPVVKPKKVGDKKNGDKKKKRAGKKGQKKNKENPCETTHQSFCIHGECIHLEHLEKVTCRCQPHYFGERCSDRILETQKIKDLSDASMTALVVVAVVLSAISLIAITIIIVVHTHKKYANRYEGEVEEKRKLGQENGSGELDV